MDRLGPLGRLGRWTATHVRAVVIGWIIVAIGLGLLAPKVEHALSGAGWEATGSESVAARAQLDESFGGLSSSGLMVVLHAQDGTVADPAFRRAVAAVERTLRADPRVAEVVSPQQGSSISRDGRTAVVQAGADAAPDEMVRAASDLRAPLRAAGEGAGIEVSLTGASGMWADFNHANRSAMLKSELLSWPVTLAILVLAFGSLVAAGLPLMLTIVGLVASAGSLFLVAQLFDVSIWALNFALMFALALGIDYALFVVMRFRGALASAGGDPVRAVAEAMDTAGKAVMFSGVTVLISLSAVLLVPSPAFRSMALGIMLSVVFILAATLTLLPAVLAKLGRRIDRLALPWARAGEHRSERFRAWGERLWRRPWGWGAAALAILLVLAAPIGELRTGMPSIKVVPQEDGARVGYERVQQAFGDGAPGALQIVAPRADAARVVAVARADAGVAAVMPPLDGADGRALVQVTPSADPSSPAVGETVDRLRADLPASALVGGAPAENHDLEQVLEAKTPVVIGVVLVLGFLLLLVALRAPVIAAVGVLTNLLATAAAFGVAKLIFQDGHLASLIGFDPQGFLDAWAPVFFFAMVFAIAMDYTVFLLSSAKEHWDRSGDPREAMVGALAHSGRIVFAAAAVMVAVFFTFALSGPLPPREMGIILGVAVLLDAALVRLVLLPVLLRLLGRWAWWLPRPLDRLLPAVRFGHGAAHHASEAGLLNRS
ncbi:MMPL family transporter [Conexibacter arvalis]|uniref:RND superfamily putative drug exporter n=1 Tax=Conexibacter arvalis TaxID=912552 RepID=A0A840ID00_9ACTN|nr:MMPL family transporter [Conexibacter arvalis]MBB4662121.1 RND superfamily putative drug exporter [Conexibacter arvalis]